METAQEFIERKIKAVQKPIKMKDIGRKGAHHFEIQARTFMVQHNLPEKVFVLERLIRSGVSGEIVNPGLKKDDVEYRIGYYMIGKIGRANGRWIWGQFCPMIPIKDFNALIAKAKKEGVLI